MPPQGHYPHLPRAMAPSAFRPPAVAITLVVNLLSLLLLPVIFSSSSSFSSASSSSASSASFNASASFPLIRTKRQWGYPDQSQAQQCPAHCFACTPLHCQAYQCMHPQQVPMVRCCCRPVVMMRQQPDLKTACDGEEAVAACMNGLCGQGYFCQRNRFCCRCPAGKSIGRCVNGLCPAGYLCNSNDFCCAMGNIGSAIGPCVNGQCPGGYECGEGNLCYPRAGGGLGGIVARTRNFPPPPLVTGLIGRIKQRPRWTGTTGRNRKKMMKGKKGRGRGRKWWEERSWEEEADEGRGGWEEEEDEYRRRR